MRNKTKKFLKGLTISLVTLEVFFFVLASLNPHSDLGWLVIILIFTGPFVAFGLIVVWLIFATYPALKESLAPRPVHRIKGRHTRGNKPNVYSKMTALLSFGSLLFGLYLLTSFSLRGGPNRGMESHMFGNIHNPYLDMQIGLSCLGLAVTLAVVNYWLVQRPRVNFSEYLQYRNRKF